MTDEEMERIQKEERAEEIKEEKKTGRVDDKIKKHLRTPKANLTILPIEFLISLTES